MDTLMVHPKKGKIALVSFKERVSDAVTPGPEGSVVSIMQQGKNGLTAMGRSFVNPYMIVTSRGTLDCDKHGCTSIFPGPGFVPSRKSMQSIDLLRQIINSYLSGFEGYIDKNPLKQTSKKNRPTFFNNVNEMQVVQGKKNFTMLINGNVMDADEFLVDPVVLDSVTMERKASSMTIFMKNARCAFNIDHMVTPSKKVVFCSDSTDPVDAYKLKSYFEVYKEQAETARKSVLGNKDGRLKLAFSGASSCYAMGTKVCCKQGNDDQEICYL